MESKTTISLIEFNTIYEGRYQVDRIPNVEGYGKCYEVNCISYDALLNVRQTYNVCELYPDTHFFCINSDEFFEDTFIYDIQLLYKYLLVNNSKYMEKKEKRMRNEKVSL